jgi:hypothetical protein
MPQEPLTGNGDHRTPSSALGSDPDILELNLTWLFKARELAKTDRAKAGVLFGLDEGLSDVLAGASIDDLRNLAQSGLMLFRPRFRVSIWQQRCEGDARSSVGLMLQSVMIAAEEFAER